MMLNVSLKAKQSASLHRTLAPPGYLTSVVQRPPEGVYMAVNEVFEPRMVLTASQQQYEAKANAQRMQAVQMMLFKDKYLGGPPAGKDAKKKDDKGGKKKK